MESKIKCDRQYPCSKCISRGRECMFANSAKNKSLSIQSNSPPASRKVSSISRLSPKSVAVIAVGEPECGTSTNTSPYQEIHHPRSYFHSSENYPLGDNYDVDMLSAGSTRYPSSRYGTCNATLDYRSCATSDIDTMTEADQLGPVYSHLSSAYSSDMFEPLFSNLFSQQAGPSAATVTEGIVLPGDPRSGSPEEFPFTTQLQTQTPTILEDVSIAPLFTSLPIGQPSINDTRHLSIGDITSVNEAAKPELQHYMYLFFTTFLSQIPIVHLPTFNAGSAPPILLDAMYACGALFVKTRRAMHFILKTLASAREILVQEFAKNPTDSAEQIHLILAVVLLQTIGLFHQQSDQRASSSIYHSMLVVMIQRADLVAKNAAWDPISTQDESLDSIWRDWAWHEMTKRALWWSYMHDCCHCIYFALPASYRETDIQLSLPCDEALWQAKSATEWLTALQMTSSYGSYHTRLTGASFLKSFSYISETRLLTEHIPLNPFAHFILVHAVLRQLFHACVQSRMPKTEDEPQCNADQKVIELQYALHNWFQSWKDSPEMPEMIPNDEPLFINNVLPFYWLGQIALLAHQESLPPFEQNSPSNLQVEQRFRLVKHWLRHIRSFLKKGDEGATMFWDELMKIRLQTWQHEVESDTLGDEEGLLGFFPEH
ncbi:hypothetical protein AX17_005772 [Amanita inopinata Kibby_2008]|nr:hypothetical protein AX17_005772 [Amanita inopinata Kibby_2008]